MDQNRRDELEKRFQQINRRLEKLPPCDGEEETERNRLLQELDEIEYELGEAFFEMRTRQE